MRKQLTSSEKKKKQSLCTDKSVQLNELTIKMVGRFKFAAVCCRVEWPYNRREVSDVCGECTVWLVAMIVATAIWDSAIMNWRVQIDFKGSNLFDETASRLLLQCSLRWQHREGCHFFRDLFLYLPAQSSATENESVTNAAFVSVTTQELCDSIAKCVLDT